MVLYIAAGVVAGGGIAAGLHSRSVFDNLQKAILANDPRILSSDPRFHQITDYSAIADVAYGVAGATLLAALYYTFHEGGEDSRSTTATNTVALTPSVGPGYVGAAMAVRW